MSGPIPFSSNARRSRAFSTKVAVVEAVMTATNVIPASITTPAIAPLHVPRCHVAIANRRHGLEGPPKPRPQLGKSCRSRIQANAPAANVANRVNSAIIQDRSPRRKALAEQAPCGSRQILV